MDPAVVIERNLKPGERKKLMDRVHAANPRFRGAHPSDCIAIAHDSDAYVDITEELWARTHGEFDETWKGEPAETPGDREEFELNAYAMTAIAMIYGEKALEYDIVAIRGILHRLTKKGDDAEAG